MKIKVIKEDTWPFDTQYKWGKGPGDYFSVNEDCAGTPNIEGSISKALLKKILKAIQ